MPRTPGEWGYDIDGGQIIAYTSFHEWCHGLVEPEEEPLPLVIIDTAHEISRDDRALIIASPKLLDASKAMLAASTFAERMQARTLLREAIDQAESWEKTPKKGRP